MAAIEVIIGHYHDLVAYLGTRDCCDEYQCSSVLLGQLVREMMAQGIFFPRPNRPFLGFGVRTAMKMASEIESPSWEALGSSSSHHCSLRQFLRPHILLVRANLQLLDLDRFIGQS